MYLDAVIFDDNTGDGDSVLLRRMLAVRSARKVQIESALNLFRTHLLYLDTAAELDTLLPDLAKVPEHGSDSASEHANIGLQNAKEYVITRTLYTRGRINRLTPVEAKSAVEALQAELAGIARQL